MVGMMNAVVGRRKYKKNNDDPVLCGAPVGQLGAQEPVGDTGTKLVA